MTTLNTFLTILLTLQQVVRDGARPIDWPPGLSVQEVSLSELSGLLARDTYQAIALRELNELLPFSDARRPPPAVVDRPAVTRAVYSAELTSENELRGSVTVTLDEHVVAARNGLINLGETSLQQLAFVANGAPLEPGSDPHRQFFLRSPPGNTVLTGSWTATGAVVGPSRIFRLRLPRAAVSEVRLAAPPDIIVSCSNGLVLESPVPLQMSIAANGDSPATREWVLYPTSSGRITITCRQIRDDDRARPLLLNSLSASHVVSADVLQTRWTLGFAPTGLEADSIECRIPLRMQIVDLRVNDGVSTDWSIREDAGEQLLTARFPRWSGITTITINATAVLTDRTAIPIPCITPLRWSSSRAGRVESGIPAETGASETAGGAVLFPASIVALTIPSSMNLERWELSGLVEQDVSTVADGSRTFQLARIDPAATALAHVSITEPQVVESVLTLLQTTAAAGTARCLIQVKCEEAATVQLQWPVAPGWRPIAARYASNSRSLYFEHLPAEGAGADSSLIVHLAEALEPGSGRILELEFQPLLGSGGDVPGVPLKANPKYQRGLSAIAAPPDADLTSGPGTGQLAANLVTDRTQLLLSLPWIPPASVPDDAVVVLWDGLTDIMQRRSPAARPESSSQDAEAGLPLIDVRYNARIEDARLVETTRLRIPATLQPVDHKQLLFRTASLTGATPECRINDEPAPMTLTPAPADSDPRWQYWTAALPDTATGGPSELSLVATIRRPPEPAMSAGIVWPAFSGRIRGSATLVSAEGFALQPEGSSVRDNREIAPSFRWQSTGDGGFQLPASPELLTLNILNGNLPQPVSGIAHVWHLIRGGGSGMQHCSLAVMDLAGGEQTALLRLTPPVSDILFAAMDGVRVRVMEVDGRAVIPMPRTSRPVRITVLWESVSALTFRGNTVSIAPLITSAAVPTATHAIRTSPAFIATVPDGLWLSQLSSTPDAILRDPATGYSDEGDLPDLLRAFVSDWKLSTANDWPSLTAMAVRDEVPPAIVLIATRSLDTIRLITAAAVGILSFLLLRAGRHFPAASLLIVLLILIRIFVDIPQVQWAATGAAWGGGLVLLYLLSRPRKTARLPRAVSQVTLSAPAATLLILLTALSACGQPPAPGRTPEDDTADVLVPEERVEGVPLAYVRSALLQDWVQARNAAAALVPGQLAHHAETIVHARSEADISIEMQLQIDVRTDAAEQLLEIPPSNASLQACEVNGEAVLPVTVPGPGGTPVLAIPLPDASLNSAEDAPAGAEAPPDTAADPAPGDGAGTRWQQLFVTLLFRPAIQTTPDGLTITTAAPPSAQHRMRLIADAQIFDSAVVESGESVRFCDLQDPAETLRLSGDTNSRITFRTRRTTDTAEPSRAQCATVCEQVSGQPTVTLLLQYQGYSAENIPLRIPIPPGYRVTAVSPSQPPEAQWSTASDAVVIHHAGMRTDERVLAIQFVLDRPVDLYQQTIDVAGMVRGMPLALSSPMLLAVRTPPELIVQSVEAGQVPIASTDRIPPEFAGFIRRSDLLFDVTSDSAPIVIRQTVRKAVSEARIRHQVDLADDACDITTRADIETSVQFVFRHRLQIPAPFIVTGVTATAGEANRLQSWSRNGDVLVIQLKEATSGLHNLTIQSTLPFPAGNDPLHISSLLWPDVQILESDLTLTDHSTRGFLIRSLGAAVPEEPLEFGVRLPAETPVRMQLVAESDPLVLERLPESGTEAGPENAGDPPADSDPDSDRSAEHDGGPAPAAEQAPATPEPVAASNGQGTTREASRQGECLISSMLRVSSRHAIVGATHVIAIDPEDPNGFDVKIPAGAQILSVSSDAGVRLSADQRTLHVSRQDAATEVTLRWVLPASPRELLWVNFDIPLPVVSGMRMRQFVSASLPATESDGGGSLTGFRSPEPELTGIERDAQLRLELTEALSRSSQTTASLSVTDLLAHIESVESTFLAEVEDRSGHNLVHRCFRISTGDHFEATAIRLPAAIDLAALLSAIGLTAVVALLERKRRRAAAAPAQSPLPAQPVYRPPQKTSDSGRSSSANIPLGTTVAGDIVALSESSRVSHHQQPDSSDVPPRDEKHADTPPAD